MSILAAILGIAFIIIVLWDAFETVVFPRRVTRRVRLTRLFYRYTWRFWSGLVHSISSGKRHENYLSFYGPLSLPLLLGIWAGILVIGFALLYWAPGDAIKTPGGNTGLITCIYFSGTAFFTLGTADIMPHTLLAQVLVVLEAGMGFGFLAIIISYLPALNQSFSRREVSISLLDARAGSPPTATEILRRNMQGTGETLQQLLCEWERWSAELLESHLSYPVLVYFRSQHDNQSWLAALTSILDLSAFAIVSMEGTLKRQAQLTFAIARHATVDLALVLHSPPREPENNRLPLPDLTHLRSILAAAGLQLPAGIEIDQRLEELRKMYEPYIYSLSELLCLSIPPWIPESNKIDNWQISAWGQYAGSRRIHQKPDRHEDRHF